MCDCDRNEPIVNKGDGLALCQRCRNELDLSDGRVCLAWLEREHKRRNSQYGDNFVPSQSSPNITPIRLPKTNAKWGRRG